MVTAAWMVEEPGGSFRQIELALTTLREEHVRIRIAAAWRESVGHEDSRGEGGARKAASPGCARSGYGGHRGGGRGEGHFVQARR